MSQPEINIENLLPTCPEVEQAILARLILSNDLYARTAKTLKGFHFADENHQIIYDAMGQLIAAGRAADPITLKPYLQTDPEHGKKWMEYLVRLLDVPVVKQSLNEYAAQVVEYHARREIVRQCAAQMKRAGVAEFGVSLADLLNDHDARIQALRPEIGVRHSGFMPMSRLARETAKRIEDEWAGRVKRNTLSTGFEAIDTAIGGLEATDVLVIAGRPGSGKTSLGVDILFNVAQEIREKLTAALEAGEPDPNECVAAFSIEMSESQIVERMFSRVSRIMGTRIRRRKIDKHDMQAIWEAAYEMEKLNILIDPDGKASIADICARARELNRKKKLRLLLIDFLQLIEPFKKNNRRDLEISEITAAIKALAKELGCPIILLSQVKREVDDRPNKIPKASDVAEGGTTEQNCDSMLTICRQESYLIQDKPEEGTERFLAWEKLMRKHKGVADVFAAKSRHGVQDVVRMGFNGALTTFTDRPAEREPEPMEVRESVKSEKLSQAAIDLRDIIMALSFSEGRRPTQDQKDHDPRLKAGARLVLRSKVKEDYAAQILPDADEKKFADTLNHAAGKLRTAGITQTFRDKDGQDYIYLLDTIAN